MMRLHLIAALLGGLASTMVAQDETLVTLGEESGWYAAPVMKATPVYGTTALLMGGRGGWIFGHSLRLGGGAYGLVSMVEAPKGILPLEGPLDVKFSMFGFEAEYIFHSSSLVHPGLYLFLGGGAANYAKHTGTTDLDNQQVGETDFLWVLEPGVTGELNVTTWFRLNAGLSYRLVAGVQLEGLKNTDFSEPVGTLTFKFGSF